MTATPQPTPLPPDHPAMLRTWRVQVQGAVAHLLLLAIRSAEAGDPATADMALRLARGIPEQAGLWDGDLERLEGTLRFVAGIALGTPAVAPSPERLEETAEMGLMLRDACIELVRGLRGERDAAMLAFRFQAPVAAAAPGSEAVN